MPVNLSITGLRPGKPAYLALAAVDAGILSLTDYTPPDPQAYFLGQRRLALELLDNYGRLITGEGAATPIRSGGDALGPLRGLQYNWPAVVAQFSGIVALDAQGRASLEIDLPDFLGRLELMAVAWTADQAGSSHVAVRVRDPIVTRLDLPLFLAPGDKSTLAVELHNKDAGPGECALEIRSQGPVRVDGQNTRHFRLNKQDGARMELGITAEPLAAADKLAVAEIKLRLNGIDNPLIDIPHDWKLPIRRATLATTRVVRTPIAPRQNLSLTVDNMRAFAQNQELSPATVKLRHRVAVAPQLGTGLFDDEIAHPCPRGRRTRRPNGAACRRRGRSRRLGSGRCGPEGCLRSHLDRALGAAAFGWLVSGLPGYAKRRA